VALTHLLDRLVLLPGSTEPHMEFASLHTELFGEISNLHPSITGSFQGRENLSSQIATGSPLDGLLRGVCGLGGFSRGTTWLSLSRTNWLGVF